MLKNYFKTAWKNLIRNKVYSTINILGLAIGLAVSMLIILYIEHESTYDTFHANANRIYWIQGKIKMGNDSIFMPLMSYASAPLTKQAEPSVESYVRLTKDFKTPILQNIQSPAFKFAEDKFLFADSNFFSFFSFKLLEGNKGKVLQVPFNVVISKTIAAKYFGNQTPIGKIIRYNNAYNFTVTGVAEPAPSNSSINYDFVASISSLASFDTYKDLLKSQRVQLGAFSTYFLLHQPADAARIEIALQQLNRSTNTGQGSDERYLATPLTDTHLHANYGDSANIKYLSVFPFVAALILLLALSNYISLSTAQATSRAKEIGVRKVLGAGRRSIAKQFFIESALYTGISFILAYFLCSIFQSSFFSFLQINIDSSFLLNPCLLLSFTGLFLVSLIMASLYPSILLSAYRPAKVLYGKFNKQGSGLPVRKFFTFFQFTISIVLIICGIIINKQIGFIRNTDTGVNKSNILMIPFSPSLGKHYKAFKEETGSVAGVRQITASQYPMYKGHDAYFTKAKNTNADVLLSVLSVNKNFISMLGLDWKIAPDDSLFYLKQNQIIINEEAISKLNLGNTPANEKITLGNTQYEVAGVLKDFNYETLQNKIGALSLFISSDTASNWGASGGCLFVKIQAHVSVPVLLDKLKIIYAKYDSEKPFEYSFMDDAYDEMYKAENRLSKILGVFTALTIFIASLGLFGLATFMAVQRTKEIGIRKVLGASVGQIAALLSKDFIKLVLLALLVASPVAWYVMHQWLDGFAYRTNIYWWMFALAGIMAILIALLTVSFQAIKAAIANPVKSLRTE
ncbi:MAG: ABC transporter permease [Bacteroidota bacterium]|nr:ABC transporter permease [Bacteroidota bacterium]